MFIVHRIVVMFKIRFTIFTANVIIYYTVMSVSEPKNK